MDFSIPRGTKDIVPDNIDIWVFVEDTLRRIAGNYGYREIRTPIFEHTEVFSRSVGEDSDIVSKEMYSFKDRGERSITLRPEGTAAVVRAYLENRFNALPRPVKLFYYGPMFRYDRPQAGRQRQFHQFGLELFGAEHPASDVEVMALIMDFLHEVKLSQNVKLHINSVGCEECRKTYRGALKSFLAPRRENLCGDCDRRLESNPLRVLDCKKEYCRTQFEGVPRITEHICSACSQHFDEVKTILTDLNIPYISDPGLVRGLDYYSRTAFEFVADGLGAQSSIGGGGRYDTLVTVFGGDQTPAVGLAMGMERLILLLEEKRENFLTKEELSVFLSPHSNDIDSVSAAMKIASAIRKKGIRAEVDFVERSLKARMKYAGKKNFSHVIIFNANTEEKEGRPVESKDSRHLTVTLKNMNTGEQAETTAQKVPEHITASAL